MAGAQFELKEKTHIDPTKVLKHLFQTISNYEYNFTFIVKQKIITSLHIKEFKKYYD